MNEVYMYQFAMTPQRVPFVKTKHRTIKTAIPSPETIELLQTSAAYEPASMNDQLPVAWDKAVGYQVYDKAGNCWIDHTSTIFVANVGHSHPKVVQAIKGMADRGLLNAYYYVTDIRGQLAKKLLELVPSNLNKVLLLSTGSEATEVSIKVSMMYGRKIRPEKSVVVGFEGSFHGKTMGSQTLGGKPAGKTWIGPTHPNIKHLPYPYPWVLEKAGMTGEQFFFDSLKKLAASGVNLDHIAAFHAEPYQGWCAVFFPNDYMRAMRAWATEHKALLGFDEVQAGFGRTGTVFGFQHYDVRPDIIWCAKALSASIPVSAVIANEEVLDVDYSLNSTHGGNPVGAAASLAAIDAMEEENLVAESARKGEILLSQLYKWREERPKYIGDIYGRGLLAGVFIKNPDTGDLDVELTDRIIEKAMQKGVLSIRTCSGTLKFGPPLVIPDDALVESIEVLKESLDECVK